MKKLSNHLIGLIYSNNFRNITEFYSFREICVSYGVYGSVLNDACLNTALARSTWGEGEEEEREGK